MGWYSPGAEQVGDEGMPRKTVRTLSAGHCPDLFFAARFRNPELEIWDPEFETWETRSGGREELTKVQKKVQIRELSPTWGLNPQPLRLEFTNQSMCNLDF
jgi:hypothetical protein